MRKGQTATLRSRPMTISCFLHSCVSLLIIRPTKSVGNSDIAAKNANVQRADLHTSSPRLPPVGMQRMWLTSPSLTNEASYDGKTKEALATLKCGRVNKSSVSSWDTCPLLCRWLERRGHRTGHTASVGNTRLSHLLSWWEVAVTQRTVVGTSGARRGGCERKVTPLSHWTYK